MPIVAAKKVLIDHETARGLINDAFNAWTQNALDARWLPQVVVRLADRRREVLEYLEHLRLTAEGREIRR
jgi:hypothetical protein